MLEIFRWSVRELGELGGILVIFLFWGGFFVCFFGGKWENKK